MNFLRLFPYLLLLIPVALQAQPRTEEDRPLARATRAAQTLIQEQHFALAITTLTAALDSATAAQNRSDALFLLADAQFRAGRFRGVLMTTSEILFHYPDDPRTTQLWYLRGVAAYQEGKPDTAEQSFRNALAGGTTQAAEAQYWIARTNADAGRLDTAEKYAWRSLTAPQHEFSDDALYLQGWINEGRDSVALAAEFYRRLLEKFPDSELAQDAQLRLGVLEARRGNYESAYRLLLAFIPRSERQREEQTFYLAEATSALNRHDDALRYYTDFLRQYPQSRRVRSARYGSGWSQLQLRRYDDAINSFRQVEQGLDSVAAAASYQIGAIQILRGDTAAAVATFQAVLYRLPYESFSDNAYYQLARIHYRRANYDSARHYFQIVARQFPQSELRQDAYYLLGDRYASLGDFPNAEYAFARTRRITEQGLLLQRALYREGVMLYKEGRFTSSVDRLRQYVSEHPNGADIDNATFWLAEALYQARSYPEAERYYANVVEQREASPWRDDALYGLAWAQFQQKKFKLSAQTFLEFTKAYPQSERAIEATLRLADSYRLMGDRAKAVETYSSIGKVAGKGVRDEEARFRLADVFLQMNEVDRAVDTYRSLIRDYPKSARRDAYAYNIGVIYHERERDSVAVMELKNFLITFPESELLPQAHFTIGDAYYNMGQYDSAYVWYYSVLEKYPNSTAVPEAIDQVRFTLEALGRGREAVAVIDSFMVKNPNRLPADSLSFKKAGILFDNGAYPEAIVEYRELITGFPQTPLRPEALFQIGRCYEYITQQDSALLIYTQVITQFPQSGAAAQALMARATIRLFNRSWGDAAADFGLMLERFPEASRAVEARFRLGESRLGLADTTGALAQFRAILDSAGNAGEDDLIFTDKSRLVIGQILASRKQTDSALAITAPIVSRRKDDIAAEALLFRGRLLTQVNDLSAALAELRRLTDPEGDFKDFVEYVEPGLLALGTVYERLTNYAAARDIYTQLLGSQDESIKIEADSRLKKLKK